MQLDDNELINVSGGKVSSQIRAEAWCYICRKKHALYITERCRIKPANLPWHEEATRFICKDEHGGGEFYISQLRNGDTVVMDPSGNILQSV